MLPPLAHTPAPTATGATPQPGPEPPGPDATAPVAPPLLGAAAVTALDPGLTIRLDAPERPPPLAPPSLPAPLKGLGIPPLDTRQVGDADKPAAATLPPTSGGAYAATPAPEPGALNLRR